METAHLLLTDMIISRQNISALWEIGDVNTAYISVINGN